MKKSYWVLKEINDICFTACRSHANSFACGEETHKKLCVCSVSGCHHFLPCCLIQAMLYTTCVYLKHSSPTLPYFSFKLCKVHTSSINSDGLWTAFVFVPSTSVFSSEDIKIVFLLVPQKKKKARQIFGHRFWISCEMADCQFVFPCISHLGPVPVSLNIFNDLSSTIAKC